MKCTESASWQEAKKRRIQTQKIKAIKFRERYALTPKQCKHCNQPIPFNKRENFFCNKTCSATFNNTKRAISTKDKKPKNYIDVECLFCKKSFKTKTCNRKYCSMFCQQDHRRQSLLKEVVEGKASAVRLKKYMINLHGEKCMVCGWKEVHPITNKVPIELDHIDGNSKNNMPENARIVCPNCHSLSPNYKALNKGNGRHTRLKRYYEGKSY